MSDKLRLPDEGMLLPDTNNFLGRIKKGDSVKFFPTVVDNAWGWNVGFKFGDFHFSVQLAGAPDPVLHDSFVDGGLSHKDATFIIEQLKIAMCKVKVVKGKNGQETKRTAVKVIAKRIFDEEDLG